MLIEEREARSGIIPRAGRHERFDHLQGNIGLALRALEGRDAAEDGCGEAAYHQNQRNTNDDP